uniref:Uncharacterized protein n=1 Tax=Rhizophora mucronata TaxID=61149 RepID=A0A2P2PTF5_RHIMU
MMHYWETSKISYFSFTNSEPHAFFFGVYLPLCLQPNHFSFCGVAPVFVHP